MKWAIIVFFSIVLLSPIKVFAQSSYVLPYPSDMPGSKFYILHLIFEKFEKYWYFGNFANYHYNLKYADKYLVESKTLFEYEQYLLAYQALVKSDHFFGEARNNLGNAKNEHRNTVEKEENLENAGVRHIEILNQLLFYVPIEFNWIPEKGKPTKMKIKEKINESIRIRTL